jgi:hypothetical protein
MKPTGESACVMNVAYAGRIAAKSTRLRYCNIHRSLCRATASRPTYSSEKIATQTRSIMSHPGQAARLWIVCVMNVMTETAIVIIIIIDHARASRDEVGSLSKRSKFSLLPRCASHPQQNDTGSTSLGMMSARDLSTIELRRTPRAALLRFDRSDARFSRARRAEEAAASSTPAASPTPPISGAVRSGAEAGRFLSVCFASALMERRSELAAGTDRAPHPVAASAVELLDRFARSVVSTDGAPVGPCIWSVDRRRISADCGCGRSVVASFTAVRIECPESPCPPNVKPKVSSGRDCDPSIARFDASPLPLPLPPSPSPPMPRLYPLILGFIS